MSDSVIKCPTCNGAGKIDATSAGIGIMIAVRRLELGMTQMDLAKLAGMHRATLANVESGRHDISLKQVRPLAKALQISPEALLP